MAWLIVILFLSSVCLALKGPASVLSRPKCYIPYHGGNDIHCSWEAPYESRSPSQYMLHWQPDEAGKEGVRTVSDMRGVIPRVRFLSHQDMCVWVTARESQEESRSNSSCFNTASIEQPRAPEVQNHTQQPLEISWEVPCDRLDFVQCEVQYRTQDEQHWSQGAEDAQNIYLLEDVQPFSVYEFRVKCTCLDSEEAPSSEWSNIYVVQMAEAAPVGMLDVWIHCGEFSEHSNCTIAWKELPRRLARGKVIGYVLTVEHYTGIRNKTILTAEQASRERTLGIITQSASRGWCCCSQPLSLHEITAVTLTAYNVKGETDPTHLALPSHDWAYRLTMSLTTEVIGQKINVSWAWPPVALEAYVLQLEEAGPFSLQRFDWVTLNQSVRNVLIEGNFKKYIPYNLSLFGILSNHTHLLAMTTVYIVQDVPPKVERFQVTDLSSSEITLTWQHIPLFQRRGIILCYRLGLGNSTAGYLVHGDLESYTISGLQQGQSYTVWICAETEAGQGPRNTITFAVPVSNDTNTVMVIIIAVLFVGVVFLLWCCGQLKVLPSSLHNWCHDRIPDPVNSRLFKLEQSVKIWQDLSFPKTHEKMSCLEVVESEVFKGMELPEKVDTPILHREGRFPEPQVQDDAAEKQVSEEGDNMVSARSTVNNTKVHLNSRVNSYSDITDPDGTVAHGTSPEETFFSDYEKHFMPCPCDV